MVEVAILVLIALAHLLEVAKQRLAGNSEPVSLEKEISHDLEARYLYTEVGAEDSKHLGHHPVSRRGSQRRLLKALVLTAPMLRMF